MEYEIELRKYRCPDCQSAFWVSCDDDDYPSYCPHCGKEIGGHSNWHRSQNTFIIKDLI